MRAQHGHTLNSHLHPPPSFLLLISDLVYAQLHILPSPDTWGSRVTCAEVRLFLTLAAADQEQPPRPPHPPPPTTTTHLKCSPLSPVMLIPASSSLVDALCPRSSNTITSAEACVGGGGGGGLPSLRGHECQLV